MIGIKWIKEMPESCGDCKLLDNYYCCKLTRMGCRFDVDNSRREMHCPLIEIGEEAKE